MDSQNKKCSHCKKTKTIDDFIKKNKVLKMCLYCRGMAKKRAHKNICIHEMKKATCYFCKPKCIHGKLKNRCIDCDGSSLCLHGIDKRYCKRCMTPEERIIYIKKQMITRSRRSDKSKNIYDANNFIDMCFLNGLFEDITKCVYCEVDFTYFELCNSFLTIERKDNNIGHTKANCTLACWLCNTKKVGQKS